jgi:dUTPase
MCDFFIKEMSERTERQEILKRLLNLYDKTMVLKIFIDSTDDKLKNMYSTAVYRHNNKLLDNSQHIDAGFDLYAPKEDNDTDDNDTNILHFYAPLNKLDFKVCCSAKMFTDTGKTFNTGYYMYPRSSLSKTKLRLANATGIIDAGYRGHLIGMFDITTDHEGCSYDRYLQICSPGLVPIIVEIVESMNELGDETERGKGGFGSTGR